MIHGANLVDLFIYTIAPAATIWIAHEDQDPYAAVELETGRYLVLQSLSAENFKSWQHIPEVQFRPLTAFFGTNSSGKSSLLQLLLLLKQTVESSDRNQSLNLGDDRSLVSLGTFPELLYGHERHRHLTVDLQWRLRRSLEILDPETRKEVLFQDDQLGFLTDLYESKSGRIIVRRFEYRFDSRTFGMEQRSDSESKYKLFPVKGDFRFVRTPGRAWELPSPGRFYGFPDQVRAYYQNAGFLADLELALEQQLSGVHYLGPLREYPKRDYTWAGLQPADMGQRGEKVVDAILASRERGEKISRGAGRKRFTVEEYVAWWLKKLGLIHDFSIEAITDDSNLYRVWVQRSPQSARVLITDVGFGVSQILPVITLCYYVQPGSTVILEQPEIHLHPAVQAGLADVLLDAIRVKNIQIVLESHSEHLLRRLQRRIAEEEASSKDISLYFCTYQGGSSRLLPLELDMFGNISNWPPGFFGDEFGEIAAMAKAAAERRGKER